jgi:hypothetical protein
MSLTPSTIKFPYRKGSTVRFPFRLRFTVTRPLYCSTVFALFTLLLAACSTLQAVPTATLGAQSATPIQLSTRADRTQADVLGQERVSGEVYIFARAPKTTKTVRFHLDGELVRRTAAAPFDLMGGTRKRAKPLDTQDLQDGEHVLLATLTDKRGKKTQLEHVFTVANETPDASEGAESGETPEPTEVPEEASPTTERWQPKPGLSWQWQIQGKLDLSLEVDVYDIDLFDTPASTIAALQARGKRVICYFSAGSFEPWREDASTFPESVKGKKMDGWDELWLDVRQLESLAPIMRARLDLAAQKGCDAVEPDNVDAYSNASGFPLTGADQLAYNRFLADEAHARGLAIGLKNDLEQVRALEPHFDFAVNEECFTYDECDMLTPFIEAGKAVLGADYENSLSELCPVVNALGLDVIKKRYDLDVYREACR